MQNINLCNNQLAPKRKLEFIGNQERKEDKTNTNLPAEHNCDQPEDFVKL